MKAVIETYRGFEVWFDTHYEVFQCVITDGDEKESRSYKAILKFIDEYKKNNQDFMPFKVVALPDGYASNKELTITGLRKDGGVIAVTEDLKKVRVSNYDLKSYMLEQQSNYKELAELKELKESEEAYRIEMVKKRKEIIARVDVVTLKEHLKILGVKKY